MWKILLLLPFLLHFASVDAPHNATMPNALRMSSVTVGLISLEHACRHFVLPFALLSALFLAALLGAFLILLAPFRAVAQHNGCRKKKRQQLRRWRKHLRLVTTRKCPLYVSRYGHAFKTFKPMPTGISARSDCVHSITFSSTFSSIPAPSLSSASTTLKVHRHSSHLPTFPIASAMTTPHTTPVSYTHLTLPTIYSV